MRARLPFLRSVVGLGLALALAAVLVLALVRVDRVVVARGTLLGGSSVVRAPLAGTLREARVCPGQPFDAGELLFVLEDAPLRAELAALEAELAAGRARAEALAERLRAGHEERLPAQGARGELDLRQAQVAYQGALRRVESLESLRGQGLVAEIAYQDALDERRSAELAVEQRRLEHGDAAEVLQSELIELEAQTRSLEGEQAARRAQLAELERSLVRTRVVAERAGRWVGATAEELVGRRVEAGDELGRIAHGRPQRFVGRVDDMGRAHVEGPLPARVRVDGYPWLLHGSVAGRLTRIDDVSGEGPGFEVEVTLSEVLPDAPPAERPVPPLFEGMGAESRILVEQRTALGRLLLERLLGDAEP